MVIAPDDGPIMLFVVTSGDQAAVIVVSLQIEPFG
jgi:hypothetical protein